VDKDKAEIFACGWFAGKYAGVSEIFNVVQKEIDSLEKDKAEKRELNSRHPGQNGYA
jgi:hypothetical protein